MSQPGKNSKARGSKRSEVSLKILVVGSAGSGKTCLVRRLCGLDFQTDYLQTLGSELYVCSETIQTSRGKEGATFKFWSCGGHMRYRPLLGPLFKEAQGAIIVYDASSEDSFTDIAYWRNEILRLNGGIPYMIIGNKYDLPTQAVSDQDGQVQAQKWAVPFTHTSAKSLTDISPLLQRVYDTVLLCVKD